MRTVTGVVSTLLALSLPVSAARAFTWNESLDAGPLPATAEITVGSGPMSLIQGAFLSPFDVDMYCIRIADRSVFSASRVCAAISEPDLWLFDANGNGISLWDGCMFSQVKVTGAFVPTNGVYYLAISASDLNAIGVASQPIWNPPSISAERVPDGPGAPGPINSWGGTPQAVPSNYTISLSGATFCDTPVPAEAHTWSGVKARYH